MGGYMPTGDMEFDSFQKVLMTEVVAHATTWSIPAARVTAMTALQTVWDAAYLKYVTQGSIKGSATRGKDDAHANYDSKLREFVAEWLAANSNVTDEDRVRMGLTVAAETHTPVGVPTTFPALTIDISVPMQHSLRYSDEEGHGKAKPEGVHGCEIWAKVEDTATAATAKFEFVATCTKAPYINKFEAADAGKKVTYRGRWVNTKGQSGPFGREVHSLVVD